MISRRLPLFPQDVAERLPNPSNYPSELLITSDTGGHNKYSSQSRKLKSQNLDWLQNALKAAIVALRLF